MSIGDILFNDYNLLANISSNIIKEKKINYTNSTGITELKKTILSIYDYQQNYNENNVIICNGAKHCLFNCLFSILEENDEVIIPIPYWPSYVDLTLLMKSKPIFVKNNSFIVKAEEIEKKITKKTKALIINNPNNPSGMIVDEKELEKIIDLAIKYNFYLICDEVYMDIYFSKRTKSILELKKSMLIKDKLIIINSVSKRFGLSGLRLGYMILPSSLVEVVKALQSNMTSNPNTIAQYTVDIILKEHQNINTILRKRLKSRKDYIIEKLKKLSSIRIKNYSEFGIYLLIETKEDSKIIFDKLLKEEGVAVMPGEVFGLEKYIRVSFSGKDEEFIEGVDRIVKFFNKKIDK
ncbi:MAG: pyridoxal phosphate-dependent aminotransferase [Candidatus Fusobacterium pullicola]|uniref:Aminotransferase n=1 Tax=Candidatus Fusobacterium pullicola TaxID=2838601 RepID=A0A9E2KZJ8_9FUSO|nr:pyridoxal phosphate-dependent aminotransferase [Candidatus Fusobacterium pullicola]